MELYREVVLLRSAVTSFIGEDPEGEYRPAFVAEVFRALSEPATQTFTTPEAFLKIVRSV